MKRRASRAIYPGCPSALRRHPLLAAWTRRLIRHPVAPRVPRTRRRPEPLAGLRRRRRNALVPLMAALVGITECSPESITDFPQL
jgi:hypothetical protein